MQFEITAVSAGKQRRTISADSETSLLGALRSAGVYLPAPCGGRGSCGKCAVRVSAGAPQAGDADRAFFSQQQLDSGWRLACAAFPSGSITLEIPESGEDLFSSINIFMLNDAGETPPQEAAAAPSYPLPPGRAFPGYTIAVDIGTTTLGFVLLDMRTGKIAGHYSAVNRQREYGGDVVSRIERSNSGGLSLLSKCIRGQIQEGINALCSQAGLAPRDIHQIALVGNTVMLHLLQGLSCQGLGKAPFTPVTLDMACVDYREIFEGDLSCQVIILPGIASYVGADITAGIFFTELHRRGKAAVLLDIGTNGEMALAWQDTILCTATAAGPAFEGATILWGTGSVPGAISRVQFRGGGFEPETIAARPPVGICGSGVVDIVYQGLKHGYILPSGRFSETLAEGGIVLAQAPDGRDIVFCQKDVRELQLAKSAIRSGLDALLNHAGLGYNDIQRLYIAGGFGFSLNMESAAGIGLIPQALLPKVSFVGNSALGGAVKYLLRNDGKETLCEIIKQTKEFSLTSDKYFAGQFIENINL